MLFPLLLTTSASTCLKHSRKLWTTFFSIALYTDSSSLPSVVLVLILYPTFVLSLETGGDKHKLHLQNCLPPSLPSCTESRNLPFFLQIFRCHPSLQEETSFVQDPNGMSVMRSGKSLDSASSSVTSPLVHQHV